jgi:hypothetical protein
MNPPSSSSKRPAAFPLASSSAEKRPRIVLPDAQLTELSDNMKRNRKRWNILIKAAETDDSLWWHIYSDVLSHLTQELASTDMKRDVIASPNPQGANNILMSFNEDELEQWKVGVLNGVEKDDWIDLILHRMYISGDQIRSH